jgi:hypothetical protein
MRLVRRLTPHSDIWTLPNDDAERQVWSTEDLESAAAWIVEGDGLLVIKV